MLHVDTFHYGEKMEGCLKLQADERLHFQGASGKFLLFNTTNLITV